MKSAERTFTRHTMYYLRHAEYQFVDYAQISPVTHLGVYSTTCTITRRAVCGKLYKKSTGLSYARHLCDACRVIGAHAIREGRYAYAIPIQLKPWAGTWVGEMIDEVTVELFGDDAVRAVGPFCTIDDAWYYARHAQYRSAFPSDIPGIRLAHIVGELAANHPILAADMRARPAGVQICVRIRDRVPPGTLYMIIEEIDAAAQTLGYGAAIVPIGRITDTHVDICVPHGIAWPYVAKDHYDTVYRPVLGGYSADAPRLESKEVSV